MPVRRRHGSVDAAKGRLWGVSRSKNNLPKAHEYIADSAAFDRVGAAPVSE